MGKKLIKGSITHIGPYLLNGEEYGKSVFRFGPMVHVAYKLSYDTHMYKVLMG